jgi:hypothetical protein
MYRSSLPLSGSFTSIGHSNSKMAEGHVGDHEKT